MKLVVLAAAALVLAGCGAGDDPASEALHGPPPGALALDAGAPASAPAHGDAGATSAPPAAPRPYLQYARAAHDFVVAQLLTPSKSYRVNTTSTDTYEWFDVSQIDADVAMAKEGDLTYLPYVDDAYGFMNHLWDSSTGVGGYYAGAATDGTKVATTAKYVDDNSLAGVTYLDAADVTQGSTRTAYVHSVLAIANFLFTSGVWDTTYGGGFWWNTLHPDKPTQSNALAMQMFVRLYAVTGDVTYRDWATSVKAWLEATLWQDHEGLFAWKMEAAGPNKIFFAYDQAIAIEAYLLYAQVLGDTAASARAERMANGLVATLWDTANGGFVTQTANRQLTPVFSGWVSQSFARLYDADHDPKWLDYARKNVDALNAKLRDPATGGYFSACDPDGGNRTTGMQTVDQSWMQRVQAILSQYEP